MGNAECGMRNAEFLASIGNLKSQNADNVIVEPLHSAFRIPHSAFPIQLRLFSVKNDMASMRVRSSFLKTPRTADVMVVAPAFLTPRIVMHR